MPLTGTCELIVSASGISIQAKMTRMASQGIEPVDTDLPPGLAGTLSTRTDNDTGIVAVSPDHAIKAGELVDVYWDGGLRHGMAAMTDNYVLSANVAYGNTTTELGFLARGNIANQTGYVLSLNSHDSYFNLIKLDPTKPNGFENLMNYHVPDLSFEPDVTYTITFFVNDATLHGELRNSAGAILATIDWSDDTYTTGVIGAWAWKATPSGSIAGTWTNLSLGTMAFSTLSAYPQEPNTFVQSDGGRSLHVEDPSGQFPLVAGYAVLGATNSQVKIDQGAGANLPPQGTAMIVTKQVDLDVTFDGDNLVLIAASTTQRSHLTFVDAGGTALQAIELGAGEAWAWVASTGATNPLSGNAVASLRASNGSSTNSSNLKLTGLQYPA